MDYDGFYWIGSIGHGMCYMMYPSWQLTGSYDAFILYRITPMNQMHEIYLVDYLYIYYA